MEWKYISGTREPESFEIVNCVKGKMKNKFCIIEKKNVILNKITLKRKTTKHTAVGKEGRESQKKKV